MGSSLDMLPRPPLLCQNRSVLSVQRLWTYKHIATRFLLPALRPLVLRILCLPLFVLAASVSLGAGDPKRAAQPKKKDPSKEQAVAQPVDLYVAPGVKVELLYVSEP